MKEGDSGTVDLAFTVTLAPAQDQPVTVDYADSGFGTATSGADYEAVTRGTLTFAPGERAKTITVAVIGDEVDEVDETVEIALSDATGGATVGVAIGAGTIADDDEAAVEIFGSSGVDEGDTGSRTMVFAVTLNPVSGPAGQGQLCGFGHWLGDPGAPTTRRWRPAR